MSTRNDLALYEREAATWWTSESKAFRSLRAKCAHDLELIRAEWGERLSGASVVDLGCGGGFLSLGLAELGANVVGVDLSRAALGAAREQARLCGLRVRFLCADVADCPLESENFDFALLHDVLEHVEDPRRVLAEAARLVRPGGGLFASTIDRGLASTLQVVWLGEGLGLIPRGTHDPRLFLTPGELDEHARAAGLRTTRTVRCRADLPATVRDWTIRLRVARRGPVYASFLAKDRN
jgi:2-polyprenyl-6-hydroxyphenyl methylase/3-demethylubiquinone-9 3-methyltransferase